MIQPFGREHYQRLLAGRRGFQSARPGTVVGKANRRGSTRREWTDLPESGGVGTVRHSQSRPLANRSQRCDASAHGIACLARRHHPWHCRHRWANVAPVVVHPVKASARFRGHLRGIGGHRLSSYAFGSCGQWRKDHGSLGTRHRRNCLVANFQAA